MITLPDKGFSPGSFMLMMVLYSGDQSPAKYKPRSCTQPLKSSCVILLGLFNKKCLGSSNSTGACSTVTRSRVSLKGKGPILELTLLMELLVLYCTTRLPPDST